MVNRDPDGHERAAYYTEPHWPNVPSLELQLRPGYEYTTHRGPDFETHQFRNPQDTGVLSIYLGSHPSFSTSGQSTEIEGITWYTQDTDYGFFSEALPIHLLDADHEDLLIHVFIHAKTRDALREQQAAAATLREH